MLNREDQSLAYAELDGTGQQTNIYSKQNQKPSRGGMGNWHPNLGMGRLFLFVFRCRIDRLSNLMEEFGLANNLRSKLIVVNLAQYSWFIIGMISTVGNEMAGRLVICPRSRLCRSQAEHLALMEQTFGHGTIGRQLPLTPRSFLTADGGRGRYQSGHPYRN